MARLALSLLGGFRVLLDGEPVTTFAYDKVRALLAYLAVESNRRRPDPVAHRRESLAGLLWPDWPERAARTNLLGEITAELRAEACPAPWGDPEDDTRADAPHEDWSALRLSLGPHEVATLYLDLARGRWVPRNLDEHRGVWATAHRR